MKAFFIVKNGVQHNNNEKFKVVDDAQKNEILQRLNLSGFDSSQYTFYDESELEKDNKYFSAYNNAIFEVYFPTHYDTKSARYVYTYAAQTINNDDKIVGVHRWDPINVQNDNISSILYLADNSVPEEYRRVLVAFKEKPAAEGTQCEK